MSKTVSYTKIKQNISLCKELIIYMGPLFGSPVKLTEPVMYHFSYTTKAMAVDVVSYLIKEK